MDKTLYKQRQVAQLSQRDRAMLRATEYFAKSLKVTQDHRTFAPAGESMSAQQSARPHDHCGWPTAAWLAYGQCLQPAHLAYGQCVAHAVGGWDDVEIHHDGQWEDEIKTKCPAAATLCTAWSRGINIIASNIMVGWFVFNGTFSIKTLYHAMQKVKVC